MRTWRHVSHHDPCRICNKLDWCAVSADGAWALCRRIDTGAGCHKVDKGGADFWVYRLDGHAPCRQPAIELPSQTQPERAEPTILDGAYRALLGALALSARHSQALQQRGLSDVEILHRGYRTLTFHGRAALARRLVDRFGPEVCSTIPGLYIAQHNDRHYWSLAGAVGLLIPSRNLDGHITALKVRADDPIQGPKYTTVSSAKHGGPSPGAQTHVPLYEGARGTTIRLTEGELKADVGTALSGLLTLSIPGAALWRRALPVLAELRPQQVLLAFDTDWRSNSHVAQALGQAAFALLKAGYEVQVEDWDPALGKGVDDCLAAGGIPARQSSALAFGASLRGHARAWTGQLQTVAAEEIPPWH